MSKRVREKLIPGSWEENPCSPLNWPGLPYLQVPYSRIPIFSHREYLEVMTPNSDGNHHEWKPFEHYKFSVSDSGGKSVYEYLTLDDPYGHFNVSRTSNRWAFYRGWYDDGSRTLVKDLPSWFDPSKENSDFVSLPDWVGNAAARSAKSMLPTIKAELSLINSIIELKDFKSLPETVRKLDALVHLGTGTLKAIYHMPFNSIWRNLRNVARNVAHVHQGSPIVHTGADSYLQAQFNLLPLLSDICGIHSALARFERRINDLVAREGRTRVMHYTFPISEYMNSTESSGASLPYWDQYDYSRKTYADVIFRRTVYPDPTVFHAEIEYNYNYTRYQREHAHVLALLDALGVNLNPAIIWNAIPWSFVVDWVFGVNRWLAQYTNYNMEPQINIHRFLYSIKRNRRILVEQRLNPPQPVPGYASTIWNQLPMATETAYRRVLASLSSSLIESSGISPKEYTLGAALVLSRRRRRTRS